MPSPGPAPVPAAARPPDPELVAVLVGSTVLGLVGLAATGLLALLGLIFLGEANGSLDPTFVLVAFPVGAVVASGYALLWGYWRVRLWACSALCNGEGVLVAASLLMGYVQGALLLVVVGHGEALSDLLAPDAGLYLVALGWTAWMTRTSIRRVRRARRAAAARAD